jgi:small basic protein
MEMYKDTKNRWMIKITTFFAFVLLAVQVIFLGRRFGLAYIAFTLSAFYCSSIFF